MQNPDPALFKFNDRPREYQATFDVRGTISVTIMADTPDDALRQANEMMEDDDFGIDIDDVDSVQIAGIRKQPKMYLVTDAEGRKCQKSRLHPGNMPREPDERGF